MATFDLLPCKTGRRLSVSNRTWWTLVAASLAAFCSLHPWALGQSGEGMLLFVPAHLPSVAQSSQNPNPDFGSPVFPQGTEPLVSASVMAPVPAVPSPAQPSSRSEIAVATAAPWETHPNVAPAAASPAGPLPTQWMVRPQSPMLEPRREDAAQPTAYESPYVTREELQQQMQGLSWRKGAFQITPYGRITVSGVYETERTYLGDFALWVESRDVHGESGFFFDAKSTRLGLDIAGPSPEQRPNIKLGGKVELDFQGEWVLKNKSGVLFRQAYIEAKNEEWRVLFGQAWDLMSPLYPGMLNYVPGSGVGNLGYRRAQLRLERYFDLSETLLVTAQWSANSNIIINPPASTNVVGTEGGWPDFQGRIALTLGNRQCPDCRPITLGFSGHVGEQYWDFRPPNPDPVSNLSRKTWSFNVDFDWPITDRLGFQCEFFTGENLAAYMGGILQPIDRGTRAPVLSNGGWFDVRFDCTPQWHWHAGFSIDDPLNRRMTSGRNYNHVYYFNTVYDFTKQFNLGFEVSLWETHYVGLAPGETARFELQAKYAF